MRSLRGRSPRTERSAGFGIFRRHYCRRLEAGPATSASSRTLTGCRDSSPTTAASFTDPLRLRRRSPVPRRITRSRLAPLPKRARVRSERRCGGASATKHRFAAMRIQLRLNEPELVDDLLDYLRRRECAGTVVERGVIDVALPHELDEKQAWMELDLYLRVWQSLHPQSQIETLGARRPIDPGD